MITFTTPAGPIQVPAWMTLLKHPATVGDIYETARVVSMMTPNQVRAVIALGDAQLNAINELGLDLEIWENGAAYTSAFGQDIRWSQEEGWTVESNFGPIRHASGVVKLAEQLTRKPVIVEPMRDLMTAILAHKKPSKKKG